MTQTIINVIYIEVFRPRFLKDKEWTHIADLSQVTSYNLKLHYLKLSLSSEHLFVILSETKPSDTL